MIIDNQASGGGAGYLIYISFIYMLIILRLNSGLGLLLHNVLYCPDNAVRIKAIATQ